MQRGKKYQGGQVFLVVVLIMFIGLTVGLSVASRSVTNLKSSLEEENSQRAFAAAEAGVEKALKGLAVPTGPFGEGDTAIKSISSPPISGTDIPLNGNVFIDRNDGADIWLTTDHDNLLSASATLWSGTLNIYWGDVNTCSVASTTPALEVIVFSKSSGIPVSHRYLYDPCTSVYATRSTGTVGTTGISGSGYTIDSTTYRFSTDSISITDGYIARVIPLYAGSHIGVHASSTLPSQGKNISSVGTAGGTTRKVTYYQGFPKIPNELFQYVLFQPN